MFNRRRFLATSATAVAGAAFHSQLQAAESPQLVTVGVMGLSRGRALAGDFATMPGVRVKYVCDVDSNRAAAAAKDIERRGGKAEAIGDFRRILDDAEVDALICAAPNHWHAPATMLACKAGKHVYVEKPCSHNPQEGEWMVEAAEKYKRCVQMGTQRRSAPSYREAIEKLRAGAIGRVYLARSFYNNRRGPIGRGKATAVPANLDYALWEGPAPHREYRDNVIPYNWHWFWHWGGGELANNGVHALDICRWGLGVDFPTRANCTGGRYVYNDDQETPDTQTATFEFEGDKQATWQGLSCSPRNDGPFATFYGADGWLELTDQDYKIFDQGKKLVEEHKSTSGGQREHLANFVAAIRSDNPALLNQPITEGHKSTLLCELGNIAYRTGRGVAVDPSNGHIQDDDEQQTYWRREYSPQWEAEVAGID